MAAIHCVPTDWSTQSSTQVLLKHIVHVVLQYGHSSLYLTMPHTLKMLVQWTNLPLHHFGEKHDEH